MFKKRKYRDYPGFDIPEKLSPVAAKRLMTAITSSVASYKAAKNRVSQNSQELPQGQKEPETPQRQEAPETSQNNQDTQNFADKNNNTNQEPSNDQGGPDSNVNLGSYL